MRRLPPLKALPAFELAAESLSISAAAQELHLTHGAVSRQIKALEDHLGAPLFRRFNRRIELTAAAQRSCRTCARPCRSCRHPRPRSLRGPGRGRSWSPASPPS